MRTNSNKQSIKYQSHYQLTTVRGSHDTAGNFEIHALITYEALWKTKIIFLTYVCEILIQPYYLSIHFYTN